MTVPPGLTCALCGRALYPRRARRTDEGWRHLQRCPKTCTVEGCDAKHQARGYCMTHYNRHVLGQQPRTPIHIEDVEWMAETGEVWERAASRLNVKATSLERYLIRHGRADLIAQLKQRGSVLV